MRPIYEILKQAQKTLTCPVCKRHYRLDEIKIKGALDNIYIFQTVCKNHHIPVITVFIANYKNRLQRNQKYIDIIKEVQDPKEPLGANDIIKIHETLKKFNGNFADQFKG